MRKYNDIKLVKQVEELFVKLSEEKKDEFIEILYQINLEQKVKKKNKSIRIKKRIIYSCMCLILVFSISIVGKVMLFKFNIKVTDERIEMRRDLNSHLNVKSYSSIKQIENEFGISILKIKEIPKGYKLNDINIYVDNNGGWSKLYIYYLNEDAQILYILSNHYRFNDTSIEKNANAIDIYQINGIDVYLSENDYWKSATWHDGNIKYELYGNLSIDEIKKMVDSVYN